MSQNGCGTTTLNPQPLGGSDWAQLEAGTLRFRDPLNKDRRFIPLRLDDAPHQRLPDAIPLHQLAPDGLRAGKRN